jgi:hypothetical protein
MSIKTSRPTPALLPQPSTGPHATGDHGRRLRQDGGTNPGLAPATVHSLLPSACHAPADTTAVVALTGSAMPCDRVDAGGTQLRLRALHVMGHSSARIARAVGVHPQTIRDLIRGDTTTITPQLRDAITAVYDAWWDKRAPARTPAERGAATAARKRAITGNWCAAAALDDDLLDTPGLPARLGLETRHRHRHRPRHPPVRTPAEKDRHMADDERLTWGFILEVLDVMERHGYRRSDNEHAGQAIGLIGDVARIYEGTQDAPRGYVVVPSSRPAAPHPPGPPAVIVSAAEVKTLLAALDEAAEYKRDRAETCADCADQSCTTCQWRLQAADAYDQLASQMTQAAEASTTRHRDPGHAAPPSAGPQAAADREAGQ